MIYQEELNINGVVIIHSYSDTYYIKKEKQDFLYEHAYDLKEKNCKYVESTKELPKKEEETKGETE